MICTTLNAIEKLPYRDAWEGLLLGLGKTEADDEPIPFSKIVEINGIEDALWATRAAPEYDKEWRLFAVWCAREASQYTNDWRVVYAIQIIERYAHGTASLEQLEEARAGVEDSGATLDALFGASNPTWNTMFAAKEAASVAMGEDASVAAYASAICLSWAIANDASKRYDTWSVQTIKFLKIVS